MVDIKYSKIYNQKTTYRLMECDRWLYGAHFSTVEEAIARARGYSLGRDMWIIEEFPGFGRIPYYGDEVKE